MKKEKTASIKIQEIKENDMKGCDYNRDMILAKKINEIIRDKYKTRRKS